MIEFVSGIESGREKVLRGREMKGMVHGDADTLWLNAAWPDVNHRGRDSKLSTSLDLFVATRSTVSSGSGLVLRPW